MEEAKKPQDSAPRTPEGVDRPIIPKTAKTATVTRPGGANIRKKPSASAEVISSLKLGDSVPCTDVQRGWVVVGEGFVKAAHVTVK